MTHALAAAEKNTNIVAVANQKKGEKQMGRLIIRIVFLTLVLEFLIASSVFIAIYAGCIPLIIGYIAIAAFTGLGTFLSLACDDIPDLINEITS